MNRTGGRKRWIVDNKMEILGKMWKREYRFTCFHTYLKEDEKSGWKGEDWENIRSICREVERMRWENDVEYLKRYQAEALCKLGILYVEKGDHDRACESLEKARIIMEEFSFQYIIPQYYVLTYMYMARAYTEKHRVHTRIEQYCRKAETVLERMMEYNKNTSDTAVEWSDATAEILNVELTLLRIIIKSNTYKQDKGIDFINEKENIEKYLDDVWEEIQKFEEKDIADQWMKLWIRKQKDTYWASKGVYYKWLYFTCKDNVNLVEKGIDRDSCLDTAIDSFLDGLKSDSKNTICAGNIAALLYNYQTEIRQGSGDTEYSGFLLELLGKISEKLEIKKELNMVGEYIEFFLEWVFEVDQNNMFALNLRAMRNRSEWEGSEESDETYPYLVLRQSSLRRRFDEMDRQLPPRDNDSDNYHKFDRLRDVKVNIINLHAEVAKYMNEAIYPRNDFKGLIVGHYTRLCVLPKLLRWEGNSRFRIRNVKHLNDPSEGALFMGYVNYQIVGGDQLDEEKNGSDTGGLIRNLLQIYEYKRREEWNQKSSVYMGCFSSRIDQLNMWSRYGDAGRGCCLCINADASFDESTAVPLAEISTEEDMHRYKMEDNQYPLYMVVYLPGNTKIDLDAVKEYAKKREEAEREKLRCLQRVKTEKSQVGKAAGKTSKEEKRCAEEANWWKAQANLVEKFKKLIRELSATLIRVQDDYRVFVSNMTDERMTKENFVRLEEEITNTIMMILDQVRFLIKDDAYRDEREYRVIQYSYEPEYEECDESVPKLYVNIEKELKYEAVVFGPLTQNYASDSAYVLNLCKKMHERKEEESQKLNVYKSDIPYSC